MGNTDVLAAVKAEFSKPFPPGRIGPGPLLFHVDLRGIDGEGTSTVPRDDDAHVEDYAFMVCRTLEVTLNEKYYPQANIRDDQSTPQLTLFLRRQKMYNTFETRVITDKRLAIIPGKLNWLLNVHVTALESDGNVLDACVMAVRGALRSTWFPNLIHEPGPTEGELSVHIDEDRSKYWRLDALACPLTVTYLRVGSEATHRPLFST